MLTEYVCFLNAKATSCVHRAFWFLLLSEVLKRLDDASCDVRLAAAHTLADWFKCLKDSDVKSSMEAHVELLYQELLVHLDDPDENLQKAVLGKNFSHISVYF